MCVKCSLNVRTSVKCLILNLKTLLVNNSLNLNTLIEHSLNLKHIGQILIESQHMSKILIESQLYDHLIRRHK